MNDLLVRNPYIQGSNLFVRLSKLLEAGGFDEGLRSTTDRDICIRLADLGTLRYGRIEDCLVQHYAESDRPRAVHTWQRCEVRRTERLFPQYQGRRPPSRKRRSFAGVWRSLTATRPKNLLCDAALSHCRAVACPLPVHAVR